MLFSRKKTIDSMNMLFSNKALLSISIPLIIQQVLAVTINMFDSMMVSCAGEAAISGVSLIGTINLLLIYMFSSLSSGGAVVISQLIGKKDIEGAKTASKQLIWVVLIISTLITVLSITFRVPFLNLVFGKIEADVMENALIYFFVLALSYPFFGVYNACTAIFRAMGNSKIAMTSSILMNIVNVVGNAIFIFIFNLGAMGAALATSISHVVGAVVMIVLIHNKDNLIYVEKIFSYKPDFNIIKRICSIGIPNGLENSMFQFGKLLTQSLIATFGTSQIAANAVGNSITALQYTAGTAIGMAMITVVGQCVGAEEKEQARLYTRKLLFMAYSIIIGVSVLIFLFTNQILGLYNLTGEASHTARQIFLSHSLMVCTIWPIAFTLPNAFRAASDVKYTMIIAVVSMWIFRVFLSYVFALYMNMGIMGVWYAMFCDWIFRAIIFGIRYLRGTWLTKYKKLEISNE